MKKVFLGFALFTTLQAYNQTKKIAHRSHSGSNASFDIESEDDFGIVRHGYKQEEVKDTTVKKKSIPVKDSIPNKKPIPSKFVKNSFTVTRKARPKV